MGKMFEMNIFSSIICLSAMLHCSVGRGLTVTDEDKQNIVDIHNNLRRNVDPPACNMLKMVWNKEAARNAQRVAEMCEYYHSHPSKRVIERPSSCTCGENIYMSTHLDDWDEAISYWHDEVLSFTYGIGANDPAVDIGHYTQVVWYNSNIVGCGLADCGGDFPYYFICHYCPAGNIPSSMATPYAKGKPCSECKGKCEDKLCVPDPE